MIKASVHFTKDFAGAQGRGIFVEQFFAGETALIDVDLARVAVEVGAGTIVDAVGAVDPGAPVDDVQSMTVAQLKAHLNGLGVEVPKKAVKADLLALALDN